MSEQREIVDNLLQLLECLPPPLRRTVEEAGEAQALIEIVMDLGRQPEARFHDRFLSLGLQPITGEDLAYVIGRVGRFGPDNRAGIARTLHRISAIRNRQGDIVGLTCRIGRAVFGTIDIIRDVAEAEKSLLLLGRPGVGKTTLLREVARVLADDFGKRVVVVDTSNEIAGDGDIPHPGIGRARRMQVPVGVSQADVMIEAVENHMPEVIVIDEIGTAAEADAARTIAERGVRLVGTAHGNTLQNLILNPTLSDLVGGIQSVTLGDEEAKRRGTQKTVLERKAPPTFGVVVEIQEKDRFAIHPDVSLTVDLLLRGIEPHPEIRARDDQGGVAVVQPSDLTELAPLIQRSDQAGWERRTRPLRAASSAEGNGRGRPLVRLYAYGISHDRLQRAAERARVPVELVRDLSDADVVLTLRGQYRKMPKKLKEATGHGIPVRALRNSTPAQLGAFFANLGSAPAADDFDVLGADERTLEAHALLEAERAIQRCRLEARPIELAPQNSYVRRLQHELVERYQLRSTSIGEGDCRRVIVLPGAMGLLDQ